MIPKIFKTKSLESHLSKFLMPFLPLNGFTVVQQDLTLSPLTNWQRYVQNAGFRQHEMYENIISGIHYSFQMLQLLRFSSAYELSRQTPPT